MPPRRSTSPEYIERRIHYVRGMQIMTDADLAILYHVSTKVLLQAVKRNRKRFPPDFMFQLDDGETENLRSQIVTSSGAVRHGAKALIGAVGGTIRTHLRNKVLPCSPASCAARKRYASTLI